MARNTLRIACGSNHAHPQYHESWLHLHRDPRHPDWLDVGLKDSKGTPPVFTTMYRSEVIALRDALNKWLSRTNVANTTGDLFE